VSITRSDQGRGNRGRGAASGRLWVPESGSRGLSLHNLHPRSRDTGGRTRGNRSGVRGDRWGTRLGLGGGDGGSRCGSGGMATRARGCSGRRVCRTGASFARPIPIPAPLPARGRVVSGGEGESRLTVSQHIVGLLQLVNPRLESLTHALEGDDVICHSLQRVQDLIVALTDGPDVSGNLQEVGIIGGTLRMKAPGGDVLDR